MPAQTTCDDCGAMFDQVYGRISLLCDVCLLKRAEEQNHEKQPSNTEVIKDAELMLWIWDTCINQKLNVEKGSPIHQILKETIAALRRSLKSDSK